MAPTEILARQHAATLERLLGAQEGRLPAAGIEVELNRMHKGQLFGELALMAESKRTASAIAPAATTATRLAIVPREGAAQSELRIGQLSAARNTPDY